ncbi:MAG: hypothetical protein H6582_13700 [Crocinitomicaceae bacterium]|nr:hypothetical protein [Crocinitomicaceae bacterium]
MKTKVIFIQTILMLFFKVSAIGQTAAVTNFSTHGINLTPEIAGKLTRIELTKLEKFKVLDEFDMESELQDITKFDQCYGKSCLVEMGNALHVDFMFSGSIDAFGNKIIITVKMIDVKEGKLKSTKSLEFDDQPNEISRMMEIVLREILDLPVNEETKKRLEFNNEMITSTNVGRISNAGPRFGVSYVAFGEMQDFFTRNERDGGMDILPVMSNLGYQFEVQYIGTENFSALFEVIPNVGGMEQGKFIPTLTLLNGFRFGQSGWEFAFGPSFGVRKEIKGYYDVNNTFYTREEWKDKAYNEWFNNPNNFDQETGDVINAYSEPHEDWVKRLDTRGNFEFNTNWLMAFGRTFKSGALNIPVNVYYSGNKYGGVIGTSVGFNIIKKKESINQKIK